MTDLKPNLCLILEKRMCSCEKKGGNTILCGVKGGNYSVSGHCTNKDHACTGVTKDDDISNWAEEGMKHSLCSNTKHGKV